MLDYDWSERTQVIWVSPLLPLRNGAPKVENAFESDLISYLSGYDLAPVQRVIDSFENYDFSNVKVRLVGSIPGRHQKDAKYKFGHFRLRSLLKESGVNCDANDKIGGQFSSIGSLGSRDTTWLKGQFLESFSTSEERVAYCKRDDENVINLVYPTVEQIRKSRFGYSSGRSFPYSETVHQKQPWLRKYLYKWAPPAGLRREEVMPHSKCFFRFSTDGKIKWTVFGSHNLSKAGNVFFCHGNG